MSGGSAASGGDGALCPPTDHFLPIKTQGKTMYLPNSTRFIPGLEQGRFPPAGLVLRGFHDYLEGRQSGSTSTDDANVHHSVSAGRSFTRLNAGVTHSRVYLR